jgi:hypothetical protein
MPVEVGWHTLGRPPVEIVHVLELPHSGDDNIMGRKTLSHCAFSAAHNQYLGSYISHPIATLRMP